MTPTPEEVEALVAKLRAPLPVCPFDRRSPDYWNTSNEKPCHVCGATEAIEDAHKCRGADLRCMEEAAVMLLALTASSSQPVGESRGDEPSLRDISDAEARLEAYCAEMDRPNSPYRSEDEIQASIWDKAGGSILCDDIRTILQFRQNSRKDGSSLKNPSQPVGGEGWKLVPVEPTEAMIDAIGGRCIDLSRADDPCVYPAEIWEAMLAAAPSPSSRKGRAAT